MNELLEYLSIVGENSRLESAVNFNPRAKGTIARINLRRIYEALTKPLPNP